MDFLDSLTTKAINYFLNKIIEELIQLFGVKMANMMSVASNILDHESVRNGILYAQGLALAILAAKVANESLQTWILYTHGDPNSNPGGLLIRTVKAVAIICSVPWIVTYIYKWGTTIAFDVSNLTGVESIDAYFSKIDDYAYNSFIIILVMILVGIIMLLVIYLQTFIRSAELAMLAVVGPIIALNVTSTDNSTYSSWLRELIVISVSQALQIFMLKMSFFALSGTITAGTMTSDNSFSFLMFLAFLWITIRSPKFLRQFVYSSGLGGVAGGAAQQVFSTYLFKKAITK